jgi:hypothetical protein
VKTSETEPVINTEEFLGSIAHELQAIKAARERYSVKLSPDFNCFDYISADEMRLSQIIADLLNPDNKHNRHYQDDRFLVSFLRRVGLDWSAKGKIKVKTEVRTYNNRRLDIKIEWSDHDHALVIENKPWASDQDNQLKDYIEELKSKRMWCLIYLPGTKREPSEVSISRNEQEQWEKSGNLILTSYKDLIKPWLEDCMAVCESEHFRWFLGEFKTYVLAKFEGVRDMSERQAVIEQALRTKDNLEAAWEVSMALPEIKIKLLGELRQKLVKCVKEKGWDVVWDEKLANAYANKFSGFNIVYQLKHKDQYQLRFQFENANLHEFFFGVCEHPDKPKIAELMKKAFLGSGVDIDKAWSWWIDVEEDMRNWEISKLPWLKIKDGTLVDWIIAKAETCYHVLKQID